MKKNNYFSLLLAVSGFMITISELEAVHGTKLSQQPLFIDLASKDHRIVDAAYSNNLSEVKKLIREGVDVNATDSNGNTALINAAYHGYAEVAQALINAPKINFEIANQGGSTALVQAARKNHLDIVNALINAGASLTVKKGWTPLRVAQYYGNNNVTKALQQAEKKRSQ